MRKYYLFLAFVLLGMTSCMDTYYVTNKATFDNAISTIKSQMEERGFNLNGSNSITHNETVVTGVSYSSESGYGTAMANNYITQDTYRFADSLGNTMSYSIVYCVQQTTDGKPYVVNSKVCGCETSNPKDYDRLCGDESVVKQINNLPKDQTINRVNVVNTSLAVTGVLVGLALVIMSFARTLGRW